MRKLKKPLFQIGDLVYDSRTKKVREITHMYVGALPLPPEGYYEWYLRFDGGSGQGHNQTDFKLHKRNGVTLPEELFTL